jgi:hypothetical protein
MTQTQPDYSPAELDADVKRYLELDEIKSDIAVEQEAIKARLRSLGIGVHHTSSGVPFKIAKPNRRFNLDRATQLLPAETLEQCRTDGFDPSKVKRFLSPELLDMCMDDTDGDPRVSVGR